MRLTQTIAVAMLAAAPAIAEIDADGMMPVAAASLSAATGDEIGTVEVRETADGVLIRVMAEALPQGWHGFHLHETGDCSAEDFSGAGDHYAPRGIGHGLLADGGPHAGDLPNI